MEQVIQCYTIYKNNSYVLIDYNGNLWLIPADAVVLYEQGMIVLAADTKLEEITEEKNTWRCIFYPFKHPDKKKREKFERDNRRIAGILVSDEDYQQKQDRKNNSALRRIRHTLLHYPDLSHLVGKDVRFEALFRVSSKDTSTNDPTILLENILLPDQDITIGHTWARLGRTSLLPKGLRVHDIVYGSACVYEYTGTCNGGHYRKYSLCIQTVHMVPHAEPMLLHR